MSVHTTHTFIERKTVFVYIYIHQILIMGTSLTVNSGWLCEQHDVSSRPVIRGKSADVPVGR